MTTKYTKSEIIKMVDDYFRSKNCKNLYKDKCINFKGETKNTKENEVTIITINNFI